MRRSKPGSPAVTVALVLASLLWWACAGAVKAQAPAPRALVPRVWVQLTDRGPEARLVTTGADCPAVKVDGKPRPMQRRADANADFPVVVCQGEPCRAGALRAEIGSQGAAAAEAAAADPDLRRHRLPAEGQGACRPAMTRLSALFRRRLPGWRRPTTRIW